MLSLTFSDYLYNLCAMFISGVITLIFFREKSVGTRQNGLFLSVCICNFLASLTYFASTVSSFSGKTVIEVQFFYIYATAVLQFIVALLFVAYAYTLTGHDCMKTRFKISMAVPVVMEVLLFVWGVVSGGIFELHEENQIVAAYPFLRFLFIPIVYCLVLILVIVVHGRRRITRSRFVCFMASLVWSAFALCIYTVVGNGGLELFMVDMVPLLFLYTYQNPAAMRDRTTGLWNNVSYRESLQELFMKEQPFEVVYLYVENFSTSLLLSNAEKIGAITDKVRTFFYDYIDEMDLFRISTNTFVCLRDVDEGDESFKAFVMNLRKFLYENVGSDADPVKMHRFAVKYPDEVEQFSELDSIVASVKRKMRGSEIFEFSFTEQELEREKRSRTVSSIVKHSLQNGGFEVYYQPIYDVKTKTFTSAEALLRLHDPENKGRFISPGEFIPVAEKSGDIIEIGRFVLDSVCNVLANSDLVKNGVRYIEVNLSVVECVQNGITEDISSQIQRHRVSPGTISYEITETASEIMSSIGENNIRSLHDKGMKLALDDFGTGYSSVVRLSSLPFNLIKIDKSIVDAASESEKGMKLFRNLLGMVNGMEKESVVEGIETLEMADRAMEAGAAHIQGYYYARPMDRKSFLRFIEEKNGAS
ncbi:MAG: EAL domain-containing protein [Lachnospiraceae bacterium]|nr:EAL domain-containing protein [Lachnospiraceae bacterium]